MTDAKHEAPADPVSDRYRFDDEIAWLREAARYFSARDTKGEDRAHWANVYNAENARKLADRLAELSSNPCQLEAPAEGAGEHDPIRSVRTIMARAVERKDQETLDHARIALDALRARSSAPEAREVLERIREMDFKAIYGEANYQKLADDLDALYTHPAAPSADKLRIAVEALEGAIEWDKRTGYRMPYRVRDPLYAAIDIATTPDALKGDAK